MIIGARLNFETFSLFSFKPKKVKNQLQCTLLLLSQSPRLTLNFSFTSSLDSFPPFCSAFNLLPTLKPVLFAKISSAFLIKKRPAEQRTFFLGALFFQVLILNLTLSLVKWGENKKQ